MRNIPKKVIQPTEEIGELPQTVAELPQEQEAPEAVPYVISFAKYNKKMCEISALSKNKARKIVETFKIIGTKIRSEADFQKYSVDRIPVKCEGEYKKLYKGLGSDDIYLKEIKLQQDARIFYFDIEPEGRFYVIAIRENHLETKKVRR